MLDAYRQQGEQLGALQEQAARAHALLDQQQEQLTELQKRGGLNDEQYEALVKRSIDVTHPLYQSMGRCATPDEVARLVAFLVSSDAACITGDSIRIDGGRACVGAR